jgi:hypothetical protein
MLRKRRKRLQLKNRRKKLAAALDLKTASSEQAAK